MKKLKVGIIGTGNISNEHIKAYQANENVELYAFCDIDETQLKSMAGKYGVSRCYTQAGDMLALEDLDAVSVCTWNAAHAECAIAALNAGKHVLCEKPMALSAEQAMEMKAAAEKNNRLLMIGFVRRFGNDCRIIKDMMAVDYFGDIYYAKATYLRRHGNPGGWFGDKTRSGGGPLIDLGVHVIDFTKYLMGNPKPVSVYGATFQKLLNRPHINDPVEYASISRSRDDICDVEDMATALIRYDNGAVVSVETCFSLNLKKDKGDIEFFGTKGGAKLSPQLELYSEINGYLVNTEMNMDTALNFDGLFGREIDHFVDCVLNNTPCISPADDGIAIMKILDAIYRSAETGHEVILD